MTALSSFLPDLLPHLPACPVITAVHELRRAAQVFFERTRAWKITLDAETVSPGESEVSIDVDGAECELVRVEQVWLGGKLLEPTTGDLLSDRLGSGWQTHSGDPVAYIQDTPGVVRLYPAAAAGGAVVSRVSVKPSELAKSIPDELVVKYRDDLIAGAKSRLMQYAGQPWSNPSYGEKYEAAFATAIDRANLSAATAQGKTRIAARPKFC